jgi:hypothetical protein
MITSSLATGGVEISDQQKFNMSSHFATSSSIYYFNIVGNYLWLIADVKTNTEWVTFYMEPTSTVTGAMSCSDMGIVRKGPY